MRDVVVELRGGLANQLFIWATFLQFAEENRVRVRWDDRFVTRPGMPGNRLKELDLINDQDTVSSTKLTESFWNIASRVLPKRVVSYMVARVPVRPPLGHAAQDSISGIDVTRPWFRGYFQKPSYFSTKRSELSAKIDGSSLPSIDSTAAYAAIHVRRGDYVSVPRNLQRLGVCTVEYYRSAARLIPEDLPIVIVSDDPAWCRENLLTLAQGRVEVADSKSDLHDLATLRAAKALVLANSTFSWWAAFSGNAEIVIAPQPFFDAADAGGHELADIAAIALDKRNGAPVRRG